MKKLFETNRLFLRNLTRNDVDDLFEFFGAVEAMRYMPAIKTRNDVEDWIALVQKSGVYENGKNKLKIDRFISLIDSDNNRSIKVTEKMGMRMENKTDRWGKIYCIYSIEVSS